jgi:hypothetical protein
MGGVDVMSYNGWKNRATWNVALHINNVENTYREACEFMSDYIGRAPYQDFVDAYGYISTVDGFLFNDSAISKSELNSMMRELVD